MEERKTLEEFGASDITYDTLINNYYISFTYNNEKYTIEHILNVYGVSCDFWELCIKPRKPFKSLEDILQWLKNQQ